MSPSTARYAVCLLLFAAAELAAAPLFDDNAILEVTLRGPLGSLFADTENHVERAFVLTTQGKEHPVKVRLRGRSRLKVCDFPPLRLNFVSQDTADTVFEGQDKLKLVTHCRNQERGEQDLLEEYAAYRILNVITDLSYRVRLMRISYEDTDGQLPEKGAHRFGFVLETAEHLAARTGASPVAMKGVPTQRHDRDHAALVYVYEYLIANTDWGLVKADDDDRCCHNLDLFERDGTVLVVPYDLDLSGLVNANYAFPDRRLRIKKVTQRIYRGLCTDRYVLSAAVDKVVATEAQVIGVLRDMPGISDDNRARTIRFIGGFFEKAGNKDKLIRDFERRCIG